MSNPNVKFSSKLYRPLSDQSTLFCSQVNAGVSFISNDVYEGNPVVAPRHWLLKFVHFTPHNCREALCVYQWSKYTWGTFRLSSTHICKLAWKKMENIYRVGIYYLTRAMCKKYVNKINSAIWRRQIWIKANNGIRYLKEIFNLQQKYPFNKQNTGNTVWTDKYANNIFFQLKNDSWIKTFFDVVFSLEIIYISQILPSK